MVNCQWSQPITCLEEAEVVLHACQSAQLLLPSAQLRQVLLQPVDLPLRPAALCHLVSAQELLHLPS